MEYRISEDELSVAKVQLNGVTMKPYKGENQKVLQMIAHKNNYVVNEWVTFLQAKRLGLNVKKGAKGTKIVKMVELEKSVHGIVKKELVPRGYVVFNLEQTTHEEVVHA